VIFHLSRIFFTQKVYIVFYGHKSLIIKFMTSPMTSSVCKHLKICACLDSLQTTLSLNKFSLQLRFKLK